MNAIRRRALLFLAGASAVSTLPILAQSRGPKWIVWLGAGEPLRRHVLEAFKSRGIVEGRDVALTFQKGFGFRDEEAAEALVRSRPDVIVLYGDGALWPLKRKTKDIALVFHNMKPDPVDFGLVESFARPGGNITGSSLNATEWVKKLLQMMKGLVPSMRRLGGLVDKQTIDEFERAEPEFAARNRDRVRSIHAQQGIEHIDMRVPRDMGRDAVARLVESWGVQAVAVYGLNHPMLNEYAVSAPIPVVCETFAMAKRGCLIGWSFDWTEGVNYAVQAIQRILRGDSPAVIPVYQVPIAFAVNRRRAREIGIELPPEVLIAAREIYD